MKMRELIEVSGGWDTFGASPGKAKFQILVGQAFKHLQGKELVNPGGMAQYYSAGLKNGAMDLRSFGDMDDVVNRLISAGAGEAEIIRIMERTFKFEDIMSIAEYAKDLVNHLAMVTAATLNEAEKTRNNRP